MTGHAAERPAAMNCSAFGAGGGGKPRVTMSSRPWSTTLADMVMTIGGMLQQRDAGAVDDADRAAA